jgi:fructose-1,6-bisphosphatase/inositol monophosphatase family enzyme
LVQEAGGMITDFQGNAAGADSPEIVFSNGSIHHEMLAVLAQA